MAFHYPPLVEQVIRQKMASGRYESEEQLLLQALDSLDEEEDDVKAIEEALESLDRGEPGVPLDEAFEKLRRKYGLQS